MWSESSAQPLFSRWTGSPNGFEQDEDDQEKRSCPTRPTSRCLAGMPWLDERHNRCGSPGAVKAGLGSSGKVAPGLRSFGYGVAATASPFLRNFVQGAFQLYPLGELGQEHMFGRSR